MNDKPLATTSIEAPAADNIWGRIWGNKLAKEFILMLASVVAVQLALGLNDLTKAIDTAQSWGDLLTSAQAWFSAFSFALVVSVVKQALAWAVSRLAGTQL
jgi:hypothetical protein